MQITTRTRNLLLTMTAVFAPVGVANVPASKDIRRHMQILVPPGGEGRRPGTAHHDQVRSYLIEELKRSRMHPGHSGSWLQSFPSKPSSHSSRLPKSGSNVIALSHPGQKPLLILAAHYDHLGTDCARAMGRPGHRQEVCQGASDNAGGVAAVLMAVDAIRSASSQPFAVIFWDLEEYGLQGSEYFAAQPSFPLSKLRALVNLDIIGASLLPGVESTHFVIGSESGGKALTGIFTTALAAQGLQPRTMSYVFGHRRNDITSFVEKKHRFPTVFLTDGDGAGYHTPMDNMQYFRTEKTKHIALALSESGKAILARKKNFTYKAPRKLMGHYVPKSSDVATMHDMIRSIRATSAKWDPTTEEAAFLETAQSKLRWRRLWTRLIFTPGAMRELSELAQKLTSLSRTVFARAPEQWRP